MLKKQPSSSCYLERKTGNTFSAKVIETGVSFENFPAFLPNVKPHVCYKQPPSFQPILYSFSLFDSEKYFTSYLIGGEIGCIKTFIL